MILRVTVTASMSAVWLKLITIMCLSCSALSVPGGSGVVWRDLGGVVTIQCRPPQSDQQYLALQKGLNEEYRVLFIDGKTKKETIDTEFMSRLQLDGVFPEVDIVINNLTSEDTGPYWCVYKKFDLKSSQTIHKKGTGSVLLVVTDIAKPCVSSNNTLFLVPVVSCAAVMLVIIICLAIWIILKKKALRTTKKARRVPTNDVYEDMRGTIRR